MDKNPGSCSDDAAAAAADDDDDEMMRLICVTDRWGWWC